VCAAGDLAEPGPEPGAGQGVPGPNRAASRGAAVPEAVPAAARPRRNGYSHRPGHAPTDTPMESDDLKKAGLKATVPRLRILSILEQHSDEHMSAEDVYKALMEAGEDVGLATVYRVLTQFESAGLVIRHHFEGGRSVFELDSGEHHDHIVCLDCGHVEEFMDDTIEARQDRIAKEHGFRISEHSLVLYGRCTRRKCPHRAAR